MLAHLLVTLASLFKLVGMCVILLGVFNLLGAMLNMKGPDGYAKGGLLIFVGNWIARLGS